MVQDVQPLGVGGHDAVFHAVVHHLDKVTCAAGPAMEISLFRGTAYLVSPWGTRNLADTGSDGFEDRVQVLDSIGGPADHETVAPLQTPDAATGAHVHILDSLRGELSTAANVIDVIRIAAIDQNVAGLQEWGQLGNRSVHIPGRDHQPNCTWLGKLGDHVGPRGSAHGLLLLQLLNNLSRPVEHDAGVTVVQQTLDHVGAHPAQTYHS